MSEQDREHIKANLKRIGEAIVRRDEVPPVADVMALVGGTLCDINRIADALDHIARNMPSK